MKAHLVMEWVRELVGEAVNAGTVGAEDARDRLEDLGDICTLYSLARERLCREREARLAWERGGVDRRKASNGHAGAGEEAANLVRA